MTHKRECAQQRVADLQLLELGQVCAAPNLTQAEESQPAGGLIIALDCAEQGLDGVGGLVGSSSCAQYSNALGNVVLSCLADLPVVASCQKRCQERLKGSAFGFTGRQSLEEDLERVQGRSLHSTAAFRTAWMAYVQHQWQESE